MAGPAPRRTTSPVIDVSPTIAVPVVAKIPAPIIAPTPRAVRSHLPSTRLSPWAPEAASPANTETDFRAKS